MAYPSAEQTIKKITDIWGADNIIAPKSVFVGAIVGDPISGMPSSPGIEIPIPVEYTTKSGLLKQVNDKTGLIYAAVYTDGVIGIQPFPYEV